MKKLFFILLLLLIVNSLFAYNSSIKIIGGSEVKDNTYPWVVALLYKNVNDNYRAQFCSGTYIGNGWIITAAHCFYDSEENIRIIYSNNLDILYGTTDLTFDGTRTGVKNIYIHKKYNHLLHSNDIALIELENDISIQKVNLVTNNELDYTQPYNEATLIGWGDIIEGEETSFPADLMEVDVPIVSNEECKESYGDLIKSYNICDGYKEGGKDSCQGDSGGPLIVKDEFNNFLIAGIVSWAYGCAEPGYFGVNTRISQYEDWIKYITDNNSYKSYKTIMFPDNEMLSLYAINGIYEIDIIDKSYEVKSCKEMINNTLTSMLKITQKFITQNDDMDISIIFPEINKSDTFYLKNSLGNYALANDFIEKFGNKAIYKVTDNGYWDLDNKTGKIKTILLKTNLYYNELESELDCFQDNYTYTSNSSSGGGGCSAGKAGSASWIFVITVLLLNKFLNKIKKFKEL